MENTNINNFMRIENRETCSSAETMGQNTSNKSSKMTSKTNFFSGTSSLPIFKTIV